MKITYEFANEKVNIEVSEEWAEVIIELDRVEYNNDHRETRRHTTLSNRNDDGRWLSTEEKRDYICCNGKYYELDDDRLIDTFMYLTSKQKDLIDCVYYQGMSFREYADRNGISKSAVSLQHKAILKKVKKLLETT